MIAFVFPGQGSQYVGMGKDLVDVAKDLFEQAEEILSFDILKLCIEGPAEQLNKTENTQPAIFTVSYAILREVLKTGIKPQFVAGHSLGEYVAAASANVFSFADGVKITKKRAEFMQNAQPEGKGSMAAVLGLDEDKVREICKEVSSGYVDVANINCPGQIVISGEKEAVLEASDLAKQKGAKKVVMLQVSIPSHCLLMKDAAYAFRDFLKEFDLKDAEIPIVTNVDAKEKVNSKEIFDAFITQLYSPVRWQDCVSYMISKGVKIFVEVGPGRVLSGLIKRIDGNVKVLNAESLADIEKISKEEFK